MKAGLSTDNFPRAVFASVLGRAILKRSSANKASKPTAEIVFGNEAVEQRQFLDLSYPMDHGVIQKWDDMELLWEHTFKDCLKVNDLNGRRILLTEPPLNPKKNRERMVQTMFETFGFGGVHVGVQAVMTLYAQGLQTGVVVDAGDGVTHIVPVFDGYALPHLTRRLDIAGRDITRQLVQLLFNRGYQQSFHSDSDLETVRKIKEQLCFVSADLDIDRRLGRETTALLSEYHISGNGDRPLKLKLAEERFEAPEILFQPSLIGKECPGLAEQLFLTIQGADMDLRSELYRNIVLSGGSTMFPGLPTRLERDLRDLHTKRIAGGTASNKLKIKILDPPKRKHAVFTGAAVLADLMADNAAFWISKQEWDEQGARIIDLKMPR